MYMGMVRCGWVVVCFSLLRQDAVECSQGLRFKQTILMV